LLRRAIRKNFTDVSEKLALSIITAIALMMMMMMMDHTLGAATTQKKTIFMLAAVST
jgi:hypothetical protein